MAFKIGDLFWKIKGETSDIDKKLKTTDTATSSTQTKFGKLQTVLSKAAPWIAAGAAAVALGKKVLALGVDAGNAADKLLDLEEITGLNTDTLQELQYIAADSGVSFDGLTGAVTKFTAKIPDLEGTSNVADAFQSLGVNLRDSNGEIRDSNDLFPEMIKSLQNVENTTERNATAQQLFGRSLSDLAPVLGLTNDEFDGLREKADAAGAVIGGDALTAANDFRKGLDTAKLAVDQAKISLGTQFAPVLSEVVIPIVETAAGIINGLATAIGALNDLIMEPDDREDQISRELDFLDQEINRVESLTRLSQAQRDVLTENYETRKTELNAELRALAYQAQGVETVTDETEKQTESQKKLADAVDDTTDAAEEEEQVFTDTGQAIIGQALVPMTDAARELWKAYGEGVAEAKDQTEELTDDLAAFKDIAESALASAFGGFSDLGEALYNNEDAADAFGAAMLGSISDLLGALGAQLAAQAAANLLLGDVPLFIAGGVASAAAYVASGVVGAAASSYEDGGIVPGYSYTGDNVTAKVNSGEMILNTEQQTRLFDMINSGSGGSVTINNLISTGKEAEIRSTAELLYPYLQEVKVRRGE